MYSEVVFGALENGVVGGWFGDGGERVSYYRSE